LQDEPNGNHNVPDSEPDQTTNFVSIGQILDILSRERRLTSKIAIKGKLKQKTNICDSLIKNEFAQT
jgi:hypothetical protein